MIENIIKYNTGKTTGKTSLQITDDLVIVLFRKDFELDNSTFPPTVTEKPDQVEYTTDLTKVDEQIAKLTNELATLTAFRDEVAPLIEAAEVTLASRIATEEEEQ